MFRGYNIFNVLWDIVTFRLRLVPNQLAAERYDICQNCELRSTTLNVCSVCGCFVKAKTKLKKASCPMEKW